MRAVKRFKLSKFSSCILLGAFVLSSGCDRFLKQEDKPVKFNSKPKVKEAVDLDKALKARVDAGILNLQAGDPQRALHHFNKAREWNNESSDLHNGFAMLYRYEGDAKKEEEYYKLAIKYNKKDPKIHHNYGSFLCDQQRYNEGLKQLKMAAGNYSYKNRHQSFENLGLCAIKEGDRELAFNSFNRAYRIDKEMPITILNLSMLEFETGNNQRAYRLFKKYMGLDRHTAQSLWLGIQLERIFGDKDALASYELALRRLFPRSNEFQFYQSSLTH